MRLRSPLLGSFNRLVQKEMRRNVSVKLSFRVFGSGTGAALRKPKRQNLTQSPTLKILTTLTCTLSHLNRNSQLKHRTLRSTIGDARLLDDANQGVVGDAVHLQGAYILFKVPGLLFLVGPRAHPTRGQT